MHREEIPPHKYIDAIVEKYCINAIGEKYDLQRYINVTESDINVSTEKRCHCYHREAMPHIV